MNLKQHCERVIKQNHYGNEYDEHLKVCLKKEIKTINAEMIELFYEYFPLHYAMDGDIVSMLQIIKEKIKDNK
jgi:hypothetical protein